MSSVFWYFEIFQIKRRLNTENLFIRRLHSIIIPLTHACPLKRSNPQKIESAKNLALDDHSFHPIVSTPVQFGLESPQPPTPSMSLSEIVEIPRWEMPLIRSSQYPTTFWNVNERALKALAKTNNALESSHYHFVVFFSFFFSNFLI